MSFSVFLIHSIYERAGNRRPYKMHSGWVTNAFSYRSPRFGDSLIEKCTSPIVLIHHKNKPIIFFRFPLYSSQTNNKKNDVFTRKKRIFYYVIKKSILREKKVSWWSLMLSNFFFFKNDFFKALKCALFTRKNFVFFVACLHGYVPKKWNEFVIDLEKYPILASWFMMVY